MDVTLSVPVMLSLGFGGILAALTVVTLLRGALPRPLRMRWPVPSGAEAVGTHVFWAALLGMALAASLLLTGGFAAFFAG